MTDERRDAPRITVDWPAETVAARRVAGRIANVSRGGVLLILPDAVAEPGAYLAVEVAPPGAPEKLRLRTLVKWRARMGVSYGYGLFVDTKPLEAFLPRR